MSAALFDEAFVAVRPAAQAGQPPPDLAWLAESRFLLLEEGHCLRDQALSVCGVDPRRPRETLEASSLATLVQMVAAGMGVTLIPEMAVAAETRRVAVDVVRLKAPQPTRTIGLIWRKGSPLAKFLKEVGEVVRRAAHGSTKPRGRARIEA